MVRFWLIEKIRVVVLLQKKKCVMQLIQELIY